jgi:hypothetical protein
MADQAIGWRIEQDPSSMWYAKAGAERQVHGGDSITL